MEWVLFGLFGAVISIGISWIVNRFKDLEDRIKYLGGNIEEIEAELDELKQNKKSHN